MRHTCASAVTIAAGLVVAAPGAAQSAAIGSVVQAPPDSPVVAPEPLTRRALAALRERVLASSEPPLIAVRRAVLAHPLVLLGDVHPAVEPKELLLALLRDSTVTAHLDAVALEVPATVQRWVDAYLRSAPEDQSLLWRHDAALRSVWGGSGEWLAIYHELWSIERRRSRPLAVIAMDLPGWPDHAISPALAVSMYADRDSAMAANLAAALQQCGDCTRQGGERVLAFVGGYHVLRGLEADLSLRSNNSRVVWLATQLERRGIHPYTILGDGLPTAVVLDGERSNGATRVFDALAHVGAMRAPYAIAPDSTFDAVARPIREPDDPTDIAFRLRPPGYRLRDAVDLFIYWGRTSPMGEPAAAGRGPGRE